MRAHVPNAPHTCQQHEDVARACRVVNVAAHGILHGCVHIKNVVLAPPVIVAKRVMLHHVLAVDLADLFLHAARVEPERNLGDGRMQQ